jgi:hypothetical protein
VAREVGLEPDAAAQQRYGMLVAALDRGQVSEVIDWLQGAAEET